MNHVYNAIRLFAFLYAIQLVNPLTAQQNGSFENWSPSGSPPPFNWMFPTGWTTNNATTEFTADGVRRNNYNYSGEFSAQLKTLNIFGTLRRSQLALGNCQLDYPNYRIKAYTGGEPLPMVPQQVTFYYQLTIGHPSEHAVADILIKHPSGSANPDTVFYASVSLPAVDIFTEVNVPIPDAGINTATDSIVILFSTNDTNAVGLNILYVDAVSIDFVSSTDHGPSVQPSIRLYPNPLRTEEVLNVNFSDDKIHSVKLMDSTGRIIESGFDQNSTGSNTRLGALRLPPGIYCLIADNKYSRPFVVIE
ncbi:MAG: T9SS type A sorting domain-containing protein [Saprospiraceae bacterium]|uniref:T9SS type A sorting domain-containing protein n=1 Tax=Candidatus Opimibacter skivensis TaxID=2982028 RepID=A0A9D7SUA7_9BACT|nr:T9SS type A sorting domain-containing protein [Candidatus Opimibacter skivensis]